MKALADSTYAAARKATEAEQAASDIRRALRTARVAADSATDARACGIGVADDLAALQDHVAVLRARLAEADARLVCAYGEFRECVDAEYAARLAALSGRVRDLRRAERRLTKDLLNAAPAAAIAAHALASATKENSVE